MYGHSSDVLVFVALANYIPSDDLDFDDILTKRPTRQQLINRKILTGVEYFGVPLETFQDLPPIVEKIVGYLEEREYCLV